MKDKHMVSKLFHDLPHICNAPPLKRAVFAGFLFDLLFDPEDGGDIFFRNVWNFPYFMALQHRGLRSSYVLQFNTRNYFKLQIKGYVLNTPPFTFSYFA
jgi:hypothetical protein